MSALLAFTFCLLPFAFCLQTSRSQNETATLHRWGAVTLFHGLPSDTVRAIAQDSEGVMWFGTDAGLARYDGRRTQTVTDEGLGGRRVLAVRVGPGGELWVGTDGGAFVRAGREGASFRALPETKGKVVTAVHTPAPGRAFLATGDGLIFDCRRNADESFTTKSLLAEPVTAAGKSQPLWLTSLAFAGETLLVGTRGRGLLAVTPEGTLKEVSGRPRAFFVESLAEDERGVRLGAQTSAADSGLHKVEGAAQPQQFRTTKLAGAETGTVSALARAPGGDLYAATEGRGVFRYRGEQVFEHFTFAGTAGGLRSDRVGAVFVDREGVVWFGTNRGVCRFDPQGVRVEKISEETESNFVRSLYRTRAGRLLVGTNRGLFVRDEREREWREVEEVSGKTVHALAEDPRGNLLVGTAGGLYVGLQTTGARPSSGPVRLAPEEEEEGPPKEKSPDAGDESGAKASGPTDAGAGGQPNEEAGQKASGETGGKPEGKAGVNSNGNAGGKTEGGRAGEKTKGEAEAKTNGAAVVRKTAEPAASGSVRAIALMGGAVYVASFGRGVERFDGPARHSLVWPKGGDDARGREVVSLFADEAAGRLWIGTANAGVFYFDGRETKSDPALDFFRGTTVWGFGGADSLLWLATSRGLYAYQPSGGRVTEVVPGVDARAVHALPQEVKAGDSRPAPQAWCATAGGGVLKVALDEQFGPVKARLDAEQGLPTENAFAVLPLGANVEGGGGGPSLLVGTTRGLARYEPSTAGPLLKVTRITASRAHQPEELQGGPLRLEYPQNSLVLDVAAQASRTFPEQFQYAFLLRDARGRAIRQKLAHDSQFQMEALPAGRYRVEARAYTLDLLPSEVLAFDFEIARAPFPRTTVLLSVLLAAALVVLLWTYLQHRRIRRSREELRDANRQLAAARLQLANEAESERRRIARDLHDQTLADLRRLLLLTDEMQEQAAAEVTPNGNAAASPAAGAAGSGGPALLRAEIESISQEVRRICEDLSPSVLENVGFAAALEWSLASALAHLPTDCKFAYEFECDEDLEERLRLTPGVQMQVYRIVQEAVSNVCRHARAARVRLSVGVTDEGDFRLTLEDDGQGFDADNRRAQKGRGLAGIRGRASIIDAEVSWRSRPAEEGGGTVFTLRKAGAADTAADGRET